jgi:hypothetical protein
MRVAPAVVFVRLMTLVVAALVAKPSLAQSQPPQAVNRQVDRLSVSSLLLEVVSGGQQLGTATGFVVQKGNKFYLVTNWHVVTCLRPDNGTSLDPQRRTPDEIKIFHNTKGKLGEWHWVSESLTDSATGKPRWIEHPALGKRVDIIALPLTKTSDIDLYPIDLNLRNVPIRLLPAGAVSIVGFPFGHASYLGLPIWKAGTVASDPDFDYDGLPEVLVDATGRPGMSGSPVFARRSGGYLDDEGNITVSPSVTDRFMGYMQEILMTGVKWGVYGSPLR